MSQLTNPKIHRHCVASGIHAISSIYTKVQVNIRPLDAGQKTKSHSFFCRFEWLSWVVSYPTEKRSHPELPVHVLALHKESPRSAHLRSAENLQPP